MMTEWGVVGVIISLVTFALAIGAPVLKLNKSINVLTINVETLKDLLDEMKHDNRRAHQDLQDQIDEHTEKISDIRETVAVLKAGGGHE